MTGNLLTVPTRPQNIQIEWESHTRADRKKRFERKYPIPRYYNADWGESDVPIYIWWKVGLQCLQRNLWHIGNRACGPLPGLSFPQGFFHSYTDNHSLQTDSEPILPAKSCFTNYPSEKISKEKLNTNRKKNIWVKQCQLSDQRTNSMPANSVCVPY